MNIQRLTHRLSPKGEASAPAPDHEAAYRQAAFTMVEIALCLAIIGFALVAIIGVLPTGMNVQKDNREETIINQDVAIWLDAIQNGSLGSDDLTNNVMSITNFWTVYETNGVFVRSGIDGYTFENSDVTSIIPPPFFPVTNGARIIGLLSMPKIVRIDDPTVRIRSNYIVAYVRSISGPAVDKYPQTNLNVIELGFAYRMIVENVPYVPLDPASIETTGPATNGMTEAELDLRRDQARIARTMQTNSHDLRLTFRWPLLPNGQTGDKRQTFRLFTGGVISPTNDGPAHPVYFLRPSTYVREARN